MVFKGHLSLQSANRNHPVTEAHNEYVVLNIRNVHSWKVDFKPNLFRFTAGLQGLTAAFQLSQKISAANMAYISAKISTFFRQETQLSLTNHATQLCKCNDVADLTSVIEIRLKKFDSSHPTFQGHSRSLEPTRIDPHLWCPISVLS